MRICDDPLIAADDLPQPSAAERKVPATVPRASLQSRLV